ncbi:Tfp pilus assembly protein PilX [Modicisalibacter ilicicola DSM 19980]|uniref:Tfp pilus assembly protein PilX n=1 Tax=Modicisalibacter ilicicola DSM 19980 TaxID=1121942 RepID=A0A1M5DE74_9GAMM|nr:PilX N-terminal domain-containing pilus assembly protein [Halomonas ilicicola]SHF64972.1 Tfp pilus assembly protein PilX [Halomonas ilicicola DSM 19980]
MALLVTLILVALMALLAFAGSDTIRLQQRLATNDHVGQIAFQAAEAAISEAFNTFNQAPHRINFCNGVAERYDIDTTIALDNDDFRGVANWTDVPLALSGINLARSPRYVIACVDKSAIPDYNLLEDLTVGTEEKQPEYKFFRVYAQGFGPQGRISRTIEAHYVFEE